MYIVVLFFILFFVGCDANMNSFNINVEGTVDYGKRPNNTNTNSNTNNNTNSNTNNNTNTGTGTNAGTNTNTGTGTNTNTNTNNNNTNVNITDNLGTQLSAKTALEVSAGTGVPTIGGESLSIQAYKDYLTLTYSKPLTKIRYSKKVESIITEGLVSGNMARIPVDNKFIKIYFEEGGDSVTKIFEIQTSRGTLPTN